MTSGRHNIIDTLLGLIHKDGDKLFSGQKLVLRRGVLMHQQVNRLKGERGLVVGQVLIKMLFLDDLNVTPDDMVPYEGLTDFGDQK